MNYKSKLKIYLIISALLLTVACKGLNLEKEIKIPFHSESNPVISENPVTVSSEPAEVVRKAFEKLSALRSFRSRRETISTSMVPLRTNEEFVAPDRYHGVQTNSGNETIIIGNQTYI